MILPLQFASDLFIQRINSDCTSDMIFICFFILFLIIRLVLGILINIMDFQAPFPVLIRNDTLFAALSGFAQAFILCYALFLITPVLLSVFNMNAIVEYFGSSFFGNFFYKTNLFFLIIGGT